VSQHLPAALVAADMGKHQAHHLAAVAFPYKTSADSGLGSYTVSHGDTAAFIVGLLLAVVGRVFMWAGIIAWGVRLGIRSSRLKPPSAAIEDVEGTQDA
jgi:hypothetical protein